MKPHFILTCLAVLATASENPGPSIVDVTCDFNNAEGTHKNAASRLTYMLVVSYIGAARERDVMGLQFGTDAFPADATCQLVGSAGMTVMSGG